VNLKVGVFRYLPVNFQSIENTLKGVICEANSVQTTALATVGSSREML